MPERRSPFYSNIVAAGATMGRVGGDFISAKYYTGVEDEHLNTRSQVRYSTVCREDGGIMDDLTVFRLGEEHFMLVTGSVNRLKMRPWLMKHAEGRNAYVTDITAAIAFPTIQGPRSRELLRSILTEADLAGLKRWAFTYGLIGETRVMISRTGVTGELGFEMFVPADEAVSVWGTIMGAGRDFGLKPYGVMAMFTLGLEKAYPAHGIDMDETRTPFHVSLDRWIRFDKGEFIGREALLRIRDAGVDKRWTGLVLDGDVPAATEARVMMDGEDAGFVTYSDHGYSVGKVLATAHLKLPFTDIGTELTVDIEGRLTRAVVSPMPFFDPEGTRLRA